MTEGTSTDRTKAAPPPRWRRPVLLVGKIALVIGGVWLAVQALRQIDWVQVGDALGRLTWWEIGVVALIVLINAEGVADPADLVAAMVIWRAATLLLPLLPGLVALSHWRGREARRGSG